MRKINLQTGNAIAIGDETEHICLLHTVDVRQSSFCLSKLPLIVGVSLSPQIGLEPNKSGR